MNNDVINLVTVVVANDKYDNRVSKEIINKQYCVLLPSSMNEPTFSVRQLDVKGNRNLRYVDWDNERFTITDIKYQGEFAIISTKWEEGAI
jgi:hypothetical protein